MKLDYQEAKAAYEDTGLLKKGWYAPVRITATEEIVSQEKGTHGLKVNMRFTKPDGKPTQRTYRVWHTRANGETIPFGARVIFGMAKATDAFDGEEIDEVAMSGKYVAVRIGFKEADGQYDAQNNIGEVLPSSKKAPYVFAGEKSELKGGHEGAAATATMRKQAEHQAQTEAAQAQTNLDAEPFDDDIPF